MRLQRCRWDYAKERQWEVESMHLYCWVLRTLMNAPKILQQLQAHHAAARQLWISLTVCSETVSYCRWWLQTWIHANISVRSGNLGQMCVECQLFVPSACLASTVARHDLQDNRPRLVCPLLIKSWLFHSGPTLQHPVSLAQLASLHEEYICNSAWCPVYLQIDRWIQASFGKLAFKTYFIYVENINIVTGGRR